MTHGPVPTNTMPAASVALARCRTLGLPAWRSDRAGRLIEEPSTRGPVGVWLRSGAVRKLIAEGVRAWEEQGDPRAVQARPGCWLLPMPETHRRERTGYAVAMALTPAALGEEWFLGSCDGAQLDAQATATALRPIARFDGCSLDLLSSMLGWSMQDLSSRHEDHETISGFTRQLTDGFETIDLLYTLGKSMTNLSNPGQFVSLVCDRLHGSMAFGWMACWLGADAKVARLLGKTLQARGATGMSEDRLERGARRLLEDRGGDGRPLIVSELDCVSVPGGQVLAQRILRQGVPIGLLLCADKGGDDPQVSSYDIHLLEAAAGYVGAFLDNAMLYDEQRAMFMGTLQAMTAAIDAKDRYTRGHSERVAHLSRALALAAGLGEATADRLRICGLVHDVGKIGVPERVLGKAGRLSDEEFAHIRQHPDIGHHILKDIPLLEDILPGVRHHHERYDGKGYPAGLAGEAIPLFARIVALADTFDAMSSNRAYRASMAREKVLAEVRRCAGSQFDPVLAAKFVEIDFTEYDAMVARHEAREASQPADAAPNGPSAPATGLAATPAKPEAATQPGPGSPGDAGQRNDQAPAA